MLLLLTLILPAERSVSMYKSCSWRSNVTKETLQKKKKKEREKEREKRRRLKKIFEVEKKSDSHIGNNLRQIY